MQRIFALAMLELRTAWRKPSVWMLLAIIVFLTWGFSSGAVQIRSGSNSTGGDRAWLNSQFNLAFGDTMVFTLFYAFFACTAFGNAVSDDDALRVSPIIGSTGLTPRQYIYGRFLGVALVFGVVMLAHLVLQMGFFQFYPLAEPEKVRGPFSAWNFARPMLIFIALPLYSVGALAFAIGAMTRQTVLVFMLPVAILLGSIFFMWSFSPEWLPHWVDRAMQAVDVTGYRWLDHTWIKADRGVAFYNQTPVPMDSLFILNRLGLLVLGGVALALAAAWETRRIRHPFPVPAGEAANIIATQTAALAAAPVRRADAEPGMAALAMQQQLPRWISTMFSEAGAEARELRRSPGMWIFVPLIALESLGQAVFVPGPFDTPLLVTPGTFVAQSFNTVTIYSLLLLLYYFTESLGRDERTRLSQIVRATPARTPAIVAGKMLATLGVVLLAVLGAVWVAMAIAMTIQAVQSGIFIAPGVGPLLIGWGALLLPTVIAWMGFITLAWSITHNRFATYGAGIGLLILTGWVATRGWMNWVTNWHFWDGMQWTDFGALQLDRGSLVMNRLMWMMMAGFFMWAAMQFWRRRTPDPQGIVSRARPSAAWRKGLELVIVGAGPAVLAIVLAVQVRGGPEGGPEKRVEKDYYRRNALAWRDKPAPSIDAMDLDVTLDPAAGTFAVKGSYVLGNPTSTPLTRFAMTPGSHFKDLKVTFDGGDGEKEWDSKTSADAMKANRGVVPVEDSAGLWIFTPAKPLAKGDSARVGFSYHGAWPAGLRRNPGGMGEFILPSGVVLNSFSLSFLPAMGYMDGAGLEPEDQPEPKRPERDEWKKVTKPGFGTGGETMITARVHLPEAYRANLPGVIVSDSVDGGIRTMEWKTDRPVRFFNIVAGKWMESKGQVSSIWHIPEHEANVKPMLEALDGARTWYSKWFWPYPWKELRISEFPGLASYAQGFGTNIVFSESIGFRAKPTEEQDAPFMIVAHESAHQWWGNILMPGDGPGGNILSEGMAHFSTARLTEQLRGDRARQAFMREIEMQYTERRRADDERPMIEIDGSRGGDTTVTYDKGGWVFWMLMEHLGRDKMDEGLRTFIGKFKDGPDYPLLQDFVETMRPFAADAQAYDAFVDQWFFDVKLPEFKVVSAVTTAPAQEGGMWSTVVRVRNAGNGTVPVEIAVTNGEKRWPADAKGPEAAKQRTEYLDARERITAGPAPEQDKNGVATKEGVVELVIKSPFEPTKVVVDPDVRMLQTRRKTAEADVTK